MTSDEIIARFNVQIDDSSELSDAEEFALLNEIYTDVQNDRPWEWLKATYSGVTSASVPYIALPADFKAIAPNDFNKTVVFVDIDYKPYIVVSYAERRDYRNQDGYCYLDIPNSRLVFTKQPTSAKIVEYDYIKIAPVLTALTSPLMPMKHEMLAYGMAVRFAPIEGTNKATSYRPENAATYVAMLQDLAVLDAELKLSYI